LPVVVALYTIGVYGDRRRSLAVGTGMVGLLIGSDWFLSGTPQPPVEVFGDVGWVVGSLGIGEAVRNRRAYVAELEERTLLALRTREDEARRRVDEERLRIAREIHDVVAHSIAMISVQAGVAVHVFDTQPEQARAALGEIRKASAEALRELRATLGVLRLLNEADDPRAPAPGLAHLERHREAGRFLAWGRLVPPTGGFVLARDMDRATVDAVLAEDPYTVRGAAEWDVREVAVTGGVPDLLAALTGDRPEP
jgi:uncharacterized protein YciI